jgi:3-methyladenine DNA glycosylase Mpg
LRIRDDGVAPPASPGISTRIGLREGRGHDRLWRFFVSGDANLSRRGVR